MATYQLIQSTTVGAGGAASISFTGIPNTYTDLLIKISGRSARSAQNDDNLFITFNGITTGYTYRNINGTGSSAGSANYASRYITLALNAAGATTSTFSNIEVYIPNYAGSNYKSISTDGVSENNSTAIQMDLNATLWSNAAAITQIDLTPEVSTFVQYTTAYLYGIKNS